jgi:hypothetical protein
VEKAAPVAQPNFLKKLDKLLQRGGARFGIGNALREVIRGLPWNPT